MKLTKEQFKQKTAEMAMNTGIQLNDTQLEKLYLYKEMLVEWNEKINLTAITDDESIISKHIIDSLEIVKYIREEQSIIDDRHGNHSLGLRVLSKNHTPA